MSDTTIKCDVCGRVFEPELETDSSDDVATDICEQCVRCMTALLQKS